MGTHLRGIQRPKEQIPRQSLYLLSTLIHNPVITSSSTPREGLMLNSDTVPLGEPIQAVKPLYSMKTCPNCSSEYGYPMSDFLYACPECGHEWNPDTEEKEVETTTVIKDANGNPLQDGDTVIIVKDLPVKGAPKPIKAGTKVKNIRLTDGDHNINCKVDGFGAMGLKSEFVKKT
jgi:protein PhnA